MTIRTTKPISPRPATTWTASISSDSGTTAATSSAVPCVLVDDFESLGADVRIATMDGSAGIKGFVTDVLRLNSFSYDYFYGCGPLPMLKAVCKDIHSNGEVSLEERMGCGFGICYGCSCHTTDGPRRVCADGPVFKKEKLVW